MTEESPAQPDRETGRILRETEETVLDAGGTVVRLAGLYGPGRWALLEQFLNGHAVLEGDGARRLNHTHRDDAAGALLFLLTRPAPASIFNATDDTPLTQFEAYTLMSARFQRPLPPASPPDLNRKRAWTSKRVSNAKLKALGWRPRFPSIADGLMP